MRPDQEVGGCLLDAGGDGLRVVLDERLVGKRMGVKEKIFLQVREVSTRPRYLQADLPGKGVTKSRRVSEVSEALGLPFLPLCPPIFERSFAERPIMGYAGSTVLADALEGALREPRIRVRAKSSRSTSRSTSRTPEWTEEALEELEEIPAFLRGRARRLAEEHAQTLDSPEVTPEILEESRS